MHPTQPLKSTKQILSRKELCLHPNFETNLLDTHTTSNYSPSTLIILYLCNIFGLSSYLQVMLQLTTYISIIEIVVTRVAITYIIVFDLGVESGNKSCKFFKYFLFYFQEV